MTRRPADASARLFDPDGPLAGALVGYEPRAGQREMASAVAKTLRDGGTLLVEAGTGTGKTLAYLAPAILCRERVLVSTGTKNLQEQIFSKDLPVLREALGIPFKATCMKGRGNYLCLERYRSFLRDPGRRGLADPCHVSILAEWAARTQTGDRAEVAELPDELPFWNDIAATADHCQGSACPSNLDCFVTRMRQQAAESDLVIVNHHLLCADASVRQSAYGEVIPECPHAILDEAHQLEDVATQYFGISVSNYRFDDLVREGVRVLAAGAIRDQDGQVQRGLLRVRDTSLAFFPLLLDGRRSGGEPRRPAAFDDRVGVTAESLAEACGPGQELTEALDALESTVALVTDASEEARAVGRRAGEIRDHLKFLLRASDPDFVFYVEGRGRGVFLKASPIDVSSIMREVLFDRMQSTILTSATLAVGDSFDYVTRRLGIRGASQLRLPSEFDFGRQAILYLPLRMPDPRTPAFVEAAGREIVAILGRTEGRAFVLFTSYAVLRAVEPLIEAELPYPILVQGDAPRSVLLQQFRRVAHSVLLATASFWQGVDVVGEALSCVIIDKLPFASPGDPITAARIAAVAARGGDPFAEYQLPLAILTLQQGLGRLIRHRQDRGVMAVLDPRLRTRSYGAQFLEALPPVPVTSDRDDINRFFAAG